MAGKQTALRALVRGVVSAPTFSLRWTLLTFSVITLGIAIWSALTATAIGALAASAVAVVLLLLGLAAQEVAQRSGAVERDRLQEEEIRVEMAGWPDWKRIAFLVFALLAGVGLLVLRIWTNTWG
jgi:hypothetical protein